MKKSLHIQVVAIVTIFSLIIQGLPYVAPFAWAQTEAEAALHFTNISAGAYAAPFVLPTVVGDITVTSVRVELTSQGEGRPLAIHTFGDANSALVSASGLPLTKVELALQRETLVTAYGKNASGESASFEKLLPAGQHAFVLADGGIVRLTKIKFRGDGTTVTGVYAMQPVAQVEASPVALQEIVQEATPEAVPAAQAASVASPAAMPKTPQTFEKVWKAIPITPDLISGDFGSSLTFGSNMGDITVNAAENVRVTRTGDTFLIQGTGGGNKAIVFPGEKGISLTDITFAVSNSIVVTAYGFDTNGGSMTFDTQLTPQNPILVIPEQMKSVRKVKLAELTIREMRALQEVEVPAILDTPVEAKIEDVSPAPLSSSTQASPIITAEDKPWLRMTHPASFPDEQAKEKYSNLLEELRKAYKRGVPNPLIKDLADVESIAQARAPHLFPVDVEAEIDRLIGDKAAEFESVGRLGSERERIRRQIGDQQMWTLAQVRDEILQWNTLMENILALVPDALKGDRGEPSSFTSASLEALLSNPKQMRIRGWSPLGSVDFGNVMNAWRIVEKEYREIDVAMDAAQRAVALIPVVKRSTGEIKVTDSLLQEWLLTLPGQLQSFFESLSMEQGKALQTAMGNAEFLASLPKGPNLFLVSSLNREVPITDLDVVRSLQEQGELYGTVGLYIVMKGKELQISWHDSASFQDIDVYLFTLDPKVNWVNGTLLQQNIPNNGYMMVETTKMRLDQPYQIVLRGNAPAPARDVLGVSLPFALREEALIVLGKAEALEKQPAPEKGAELITTPANGELTMFPEADTPPPVQNTSLDVTLEGEPIALTDGTKVAAATGAGTTLDVGGLSVTGIESSSGLERILLAFTDWVHDYRRAMFDLSEAYADLYHSLQDQHQSLTRYIESNRETITDTEYVELLAQTAVLESEVGKAHNGWAASLAIVNFIDGAEAESLSPYTLYIKFFLAYYAKGLSLALSGRETLQNAVDTQMDLTEAMGDSTTAISLIPSDSVLFNKFSNALGLVFDVYNTNFVPPRRN